MTFSRAQPGLPISAARYPGLIAAALLAVSDAHGAQERLPFEVTTGEMTAQATTRTPRAERVAQEEEKTEGEVARRPATMPSKRVKTEKITAGSPENSQARPRFEPDDVAKLLKQKKLDAVAAPPSKFDAAGIANLLAARNSPSMQDRIDSYTIAHYQTCWRNTLDPTTYAPRVEFQLSRSGALEGEPRLLNPSSDPIERARGDEALAAVRRCSPMSIPAEFAPYYERWRVIRLQFQTDFADRKPVAITIDDEGQIFLMDQPIEIGQLLERLKTAARQGFDERIYLRASKAASYGRVAEVMSLLQSAGYKKMALVTEQEKK